MQNMLVLLKRTKMGSKYKKYCCSVKSHSINLPRVRIGRYICSLRTVHLFAICDLLVHYFLNSFHSSIAIFFWTRYGSFWSPFSSSTNVQVNAPSRRWQIHCLHYSLIIVRCLLCRQIVFFLRCFCLSVQRVHWITPSVLICVFQLYTALPLDQWWLFFQFIFDFCFW